jgi:hypothetical protein
MSDPTRLIEETADGQEGDQGTAFERELLRAGRSQKLSPRNRDRIWMGISVQVLPMPGNAMPGNPLPGTDAGAGALAASAGAGATKGLLAASTVKGAIVAVMLGGGSLAGYRAVQSHRAAEPARSVVEAPIQVQATPMVEPLAPPAEEPVATRAAPAARAVRDDPAVHRQQPSRLAAEGRVVLEARRELREGDAPGALRRLEAARSEFADGALVQEREALSIEALSRAGQREAAGRRAEAFVRAYPGSPHAASVRNFARP